MCDVSSAMWDVGFVGAGPVSARKIIEEIIANIVGVALLGDTQCAVKIATNVGANCVRPFSRIGGQTQGLPLQRLQWFFNDFSGEHSSPLQNSQ